MADIDVQEKHGMNWLWWALGLLALALVVWALTSRDDDDLAMDPAAEQPVTGVEPAAPIEPAPYATGAAVGAALPVAQIVADPASWTGQTVDGEVQVAEVPTDRGFWIESGGQRLFAVLNDQPAEQPADVNPGQTVRLTGATIQDATYLSQLSGEPIDADTRAIAEQQQAFLVVDEANLEIVGQQPQQQ